MTEVILIAIIIIIIRVVGIRYDLQDDDWMDNER